MAALLEIGRPVLATPRSICSTSPALWGRRAGLRSRQARMAAAHSAGTPATRLRPARRTGTRRTTMTNGILRFNTNVGFIQSPSPARCRVLSRKTLSGISGRGPRTGASGVAVLCRFVAAFARLRKLSRPFQRAGKAQVRARFVWLQTHQCAGLGQRFLKAFCAKVLDSALVMEIE